MNKIKSITVHNNRLVDIKPEGNSQWLCPSQEIKRSIQVGITGIPTVVTMKKTFISDTEFSTMRTGFGSICWTDSHKIMSFSECFILNELSQLESAPVRDSSIEYSSSVSFSDSCQIFHNKESFDFCLTYNTFADNMVHISSKPFLSATQFLETPLGRFCAPTLKSCFELPEPINMIYSSIEEFLIACYSNMIYAEVNTNKVFDRANIDINLFSNAKIEEEVSSSHKEFTFSYFPIKIFPEVFWNLNRNLYSSVDCTNTQDVLFDRETSWRVVSDTATEERFGFSSSATFISPFDSSSNELSLELWKLNPHVMIDSIIEFEVGMMNFPVGVNSVINSIRINSDGLPNCNTIFQSNLDCSSVFHKDMKEEQIYKTIEKGGWQFIPQIKSVGFLAKLIVKNYHLKKVVFPLIISRGG